MVDIKGKTALVTGSSRGIGRQISIGLAKLGCNLITHGRKEGNCEETNEILRKLGVDVYTVFGELDDEQQLKELIKKVKELDIKVDILYNNAAIMTAYRHEHFDHPWEDWIETFKTNVIAMYDLCGAFIPDMVDHGFGRVVNLSSGISNLPELEPYSTSKWAVDKLSGDLGFKYRDTNVRVNCIDPGWIQTDMGGENAEHQVTDVLPGILAPVLLENDGPTGKKFSAIDHNLELNL